MIHFYHKAPYVSDDFFLRVAPIIKCSYLLIVFSCVMMRLQSELNIDGRIVSNWIM